MKSWRLNPPMVNLGVDSKGNPLIIRGRAAKNLLMRAQIKPQVYPLMDALMKRI